MSCSKWLFCCLLLISCLNKTFAQSTGPTQPRPLTITGNVGASANFYTSNESVYSRPSYAWNTNGNLLAKTGRFTIPASFVVNHYSNSNTPVFVQAGLSPTYKWATLHLGYRYLSFSPLTYEGQNFKGVGLELNPKLFRLAAFYGKINRAYDEDTSRNNFRLPQYSRTALGLKIGYGNALRFIDLIFFHAKDDSLSSAVITNRRFNRPQENAVVSTTFKLTVLKSLSLSGDLAVSGLVQDLASKTLVDTANAGIRDFIQNFLPNDAGITASYAAQGALNYYTKGYNTNFGYRRVQPNYRSLGTPYMLNDIELLSWANNASLLQGKLNLNITLSQQHNNLSNNLATELLTQVGNINVNAILTQKLNVNVNLSGYNLKQKPGSGALIHTLGIPDSLRLNQRITQVNVSPGYYLTKGDIIHYLNGNFNLSLLDDKSNNTTILQDSKSYSASLAYSIAFIKRSITLSLNSVYTKYTQQNNNYTSLGPTVGISAQLLKDKNLNVQGNVGVFFNNYNEGNKQQNVSYSFNTGYQAKKHSFGLYANYVNTQTNNAIINAINKTFPYAVATRNLAGGVSYNYSF